MQGNGEGGSKPLETTEEVARRLAILSEAATSGEWHVGKPFPSHLKGNPVTPIYAAEAGCSVCGQGVGQRVISWHFKNAVAKVEAAANPGFIVALVNAYRAGHLVARAALSPVEHDGRTGE